MTRQRGRLGWLLIGVALVAAVVLTVLTRPGPRYTDSLDPENPSPNGAQALARVLADEGVDVDVVRSADALDEASTDGATVVVTTPDRLGEASYDRLVEHAGSSPIVYVAPSGAADLLGVGPPLTSDTEDLSVPAECSSGAGADAPPALDDLRLEDDWLVLYPLADGSPGCFRGDGAGTLDGARVEQAAATQQAPDDERAVLVGLPDGRGVAFGAPRALSNERITRGDNAAIALRLLGGRDRLVWYVPDLGDALPSDAAAGVADELPDALVPGLWLLALTGLAVVLWRGRRLGPLVTERLPVRVRAIETTLSRGRLYRRAHDPDHAAAELRHATRARAVRRLRLPRGAPDRVVVDAVAEHTGLASSDVGALLLDTSTLAGDADLVDLAARLHDLDDRLRKADT